MTRPCRALFVLVCIALIGACGPADTGGTQGISAFTQGMEKSEGFVPIYRDADSGKLYLLLDASNSELLYQESLPWGLGSNDIGLDRGQLGGTAALARFEPVGDKVLLRRLNQRFRALTSNDAERESVEQAFASSVLWGFPVVANDGEQCLVDATGFLLRDSHGVARRLKSNGEGSYKTDVSRSAVYAQRSKAFPRNTELEAVVTLTGDNPGPQIRSVAPDPHSLTLHMHHSFIALPEAGFEAREFHPESGYFPVTFADYATAIDEPLEKRWIRRHRLQSASSAKGKKSGADNTAITYFLDPGVPEPVRSALLEGARWWSDAFSAAGFEDAFRVEMLPEGADPMDVRYNVIQWVHRSTRGWSYGSSVVDPRTGEIIKGHVTLGSLRVRQDLLIARGMTAPFTGLPPEPGAGRDDDAAVQMALARIRQLSAHEVGHTLGLAHNFAASVKERASVMDYPHPLIALNADGEIILEGAYDEGIGPWDKRAIRYGYTEFAALDEEAETAETAGSAERAGLAALIKDNREQGFEFISDPDSRSLRDFHPRSHLWDNGADPVAELDRMMDLRRVALSRFGAAVLPDQAPLSDLQEAIVPVYLFHRYQVEAAGKLLGGVDYAYNLRGAELQQKSVTAITPERQRSALQSLLATLHPDALALSPDVIAQISPKAYGYRRNRESAPARTGALFDPLSLAEASAGHTLHAVLHPQRLARVALQNALDENQLSLAELFGALQDAILLPEYGGMQGAIDRRSAGLLLRHWRSLFADENAAPEVRAAARDALRKASRLMSSRQRNKGDYQSFYAYEDAFIERALEGDVKVQESRAAELPPGSPIGAY